MPDADTHDIDPVTGRITIHRAGTYRISAPLTDADLDDYGAAFGDVVRPEWATLGENLIEEVQAQRERLRALETALRALVDTEPIVYRSQGVAICGVCRARETFHEWRNSDGNAFPHKADCPVVVAQALLRGDDDG